LIHAEGPLIRTRGEHNGHWDVCRTAHDYNGRREDPMMIDLHPSDLESRLQEHDRRVVYATHSGWQRPGQQPVAEPVSARRAFLRDIRVRFPSTMVLRRAVAFRGA
jgi:hypothetical protein